MECSEPAAAGSAATRQRRVTVSIRTDPGVELAVQHLDPRKLQRLAAAAKWAVETVYGVDARPITEHERDSDGQYLGVMLTAVVGGYDVSVPLDDRAE